MLMVITGELFIIVILHLCHKSIKKIYSEALHWLVQFHIKTMVHMLCDIHFYSLSNTFNDVFVLLLQLVWPTFYQYVGFILLSIQNLH